MTVSPTATHRIYNGSIAFLRGCPVTLTVPGDTRFAQVHVTGPDGATYYLADVAPGSILPAISDRGLRFAILETTDTHEIVTTPTCIHCGYGGEMPLTPAELALLNAGVPVHEAVERLDQGDREQLISGTHPECWADFIGPRP